MKEYFHSQKGVTLIEVLASIVILAIILLSSMSFFTSSAKFNTHSSNKMDATNLARETQEKFKADLDKNQELKNLIDDAKSNPGPFPKTSYPHLNVSQDIELITGKLKLMNTNSDYDIIVLVDPTPVSNLKKSLYTLHVEVWKDTRKLSETYTYVEF